MTTKFGESIVRLNSILHVKVSAHSHLNVTHEADTFVGV